MRIKAEVREPRLILLQPMLGASMGEVIRFVPTSERERTRLIREARAIDDSIFPAADPVSEQRDKDTDKSHGQQRQCLS